MSENLLATIQRPDLVTWRVQGGDEVTSCPIVGWVTPPGGNPLRTGAPHIYTLEDLRREIGWHQDSYGRDDEPVMSAKFATLAEKEGCLQTSICTGDVSALIADEGYFGTTFESASQFNCMEQQGYRAWERPQIWDKDRTQGPACATASSPGMLMRVAANSPEIDEQIDCLKKMEIFLVEKLQAAGVLGLRFNKAFMGMSYGYTMAAESDLVEINMAMLRYHNNGHDLKKLMFDAMGKLNFLAQFQNQVTAYHYGATPMNDKSVVNQMWVSGPSIGYAARSPNHRKQFEPQMLMTIHF